MGTMNKKIATETATLESVTNLSQKSSVRTKNASQLNLHQDKCNMVEGASPL
jgi:hypothetical protein